MIDVVYIENKEPLSVQWTDPVFNFIGENEKRKALSYRRWQDRQAFLLGKLLLGKLLKSYGFSHQLLRKVDYNPFNRPFIPGENLDYNISHSGDFVICAFSFDQVIGVDIEQIQTIDLGDFDRILNDFDRKRIESSEDKLASFFRIWSAKEAILKAHGCGLVDDVYKLEINNETGVFNGTTFYLKDLSIHPLYSCCVAGIAPVDEIRVAKMFLSETANFF